ncbi:hypothetical protein [Thermovibrio ammonificans]|jgi:type IV pilus assembly protein PilW
MRRGFSLLELFIVLGITVFVLSAIYFGYTYLFKGFLQRSSESTVQIQSMVGLEILRQDVEHAGYGIGVNEPSLPIETVAYGASGYDLIIRSTYDITNDLTRGWALVNCAASGSAPTQLAPPLSEWVFPSSAKAVFLNLQGDVVAGNSDYVCPDTGYYLTYPIPDIGSATPICSTEVCAQIEYYLYRSPTSPNPVCPDLYTLGRKVSWKLTSTGKPSGRVRPMIDCVADFQVRYDWGNSTYVDPLTDPAVKSATALDERKNLKLVHIYLLIREGKKDPNYTFTGSTTIDGVTLRLPSTPDAIHYHWKVVKLTVQPMNLVH